jgi:hypothetical protein
VPDANEPVLVWEFVRWIGAMVRDGKDVANYELICVDEGLVEGATASSWTRSMPSA